MGGGGSSCSRRDSKWGFVEDVESSLDGESPDAIFFEQRLKAFGVEACATVGAEKQLEELTEKRVQGAITRSKGQQVRPTLHEQVADLRTESDVVLDELISNAKELSQGDDLGRRHVEFLEPMAVFSEGIGQDEGVAAVVFGAAQGISVAESVDLLRINGKDGDTLLDKGFDDGAVRFFGSDRDRSDILLCQVQEPIDGS